MQYRADIDGLRAIAVVSVVLFHLGLGGFSGGYVGVDVFFVISGYLITSIILDAHKRDRFSFASFYSRRIRRLMPPLVATVIATFVASSLLLTPYDMIAFSRSAVAALLSFSNITFFFEAGYWDSSSELKPLLHTWSLGVEEQFYLVWPATITLILAGKRFFKFGTALMIITIVGYALCVWYSTVDAPSAFYLLPFRVFQFSLGALMIPLSNSAFFGAFKQSVFRIETLRFAGLALVLGAVFAFDANTLFPGWLVLIPSMGSAFLLLAGSAIHTSMPVSTHLLNNRLSGWLGRMSYSMYLVHWPIVSLYRYQQSRSDFTTSETWLLGLATLSATLVLHYAIERRFYQRVTEKRGHDTNTHARKLTLLTLASSLMVSGVALTAWQGDGWAWRLPDQTLSAEAIDLGMQARYQLRGQACSIRNLGAKHRCHLERMRQVLIFGNSHEFDGYNFIAATAGDDPDINLITFGTTNKCTTLRVPPPGIITDDDCDKRLQTLFNTNFLERLNVLVYAANKPFDANKAEHLIVINEMLRRNPRLKLVILGGYINTREECWRLINSSGTPNGCRNVKNVTYFEQYPSREPLYNEFMALGGHFIDRVALLCKDRKLSACLTATPEGVPAFYDKHHLSFEFATFAGRLYAKSHPALL